MKRIYGLDSNVNLKYKKSRRTKYGGKKKRTRKFIKKFGGMETAENVYIPEIHETYLPEDPTKIPKAFLNPKNKVINLPEENIYSEFAIGEEAPIQSEVLATVGKEKSTLTKAYNKLGKLFKTRQKNSTLKSLDFDLKQFNDTCLNNVPLTTEEISIFKSFKNVMSIKPKLNLYCEVRQKLFEKDIHFDTKYPRIFEKMLRLVLSSDNIKNINKELDLILFRNYIELEDYDDDIELPQTEYIRNVEEILPRDHLYTKRLTKIAGKKRSKKKHTKRKY